MSVQIAILILGFNHKETLGDTLHSALNQSFAEYSVIYIDNSSNDGSLEYVKTNFPHVSVIAHEKNLGYAGGYDVVIRQLFSKGFDAVALLNPDMIVDTNWLAELVKSAYSSPEIALAQSKVFIWKDGPTKAINSFGNNIQYLGIGYCGHYYEQDTFANDIDVAYASGSTLLIKKEYYPSKISFDTDYFAYLEDQDLGWQALILGLRNIASAKSIAWHKYDFQKANLNKLKFYLLERNRLFFLTKFWSLHLLLLITPAFTIMETGMLLNAVANGYFPQKIKSYQDYFRAIPTLLKRREDIQRKRNISDKELLTRLSPTIDFEELDSLPLRLANAGLRFYYWVLKKLL